jgi:hypothetical protein
VSWTTPDVRGGVPITFFGLFVPYAPGTDHIDIVNTQTSELLGTRAVSSSAPRVEIVAPVPGQVLEGGCGARIAWVASDADGDPLAFTVLLKPSGGDPVPVAYRVTGDEYALNTRALPAGDYEVTVLADDGVNVGKSAAVPFVLAGATSPDTEPPRLDVALSGSVLWPADHRMVDIRATVAVHDECDPTPTFALTSIASNEPDNDGGDGHTTGDIEGAVLGTPDLAFQLRAERSGRRDGRRYTITYTARDASGNTATAVAVVTVPHDGLGEVQADDSTGADAGARRLPHRTSLGPVEPNPFVATASLSFDLAGREMARIEVFDTRGALVRTLVQEALPGGRHTVIWDGLDRHGRPAASGIYLFRLVTRQVTHTRRAVLMR